VFCRSSAQGSRLLHTDAATRHSSTVSHLENQLACCISLRSAKEYHFWLLAYVRYLVQEGNRRQYLATCFFVIIVIIIIAAETLGQLNESSIAFFSELGRKIAFVSGDNQEPSFLFQRISITIQHFDSILLHNSFSSDEE